MFLYSDPSDDIRHAKDTPGAYEWWYFDAVDPVSGHGVVAILYDGLLFSPDYHDAVKSGIQDVAEFHPGFSLSVYDGDQTPFYALTSYPRSLVDFGGAENPVTIGGNRVVREVSEQGIVYTLHIDETLPSGLRAKGELRFASGVAPTTQEVGEASSYHRWNLVQPSAVVTGEIRLSRGGSPIKEYRFNTKGYHDHNIGLRPLGDDFKDWYWGRIHIGGDTLVWYNMSTGGDIQPQAWLVRNGHIDFSNRVEMEAVGPVQRSVFGLKRVTAWSVRIGEEVYFVRDNHVWDSGPFYQRYQVNLHDKSGAVIANSYPGVAEYIVPGRITAPWVKPMIRIRHHKAGSRGNWIQRSAALSRLTW